MIWIFFCCLMPPLCQLRIVPKRQQPYKCLSDLLSYDISCLCWVSALVDDITDFLVTKQEVDAVCGQSQERVVGVFDLTIETDDQ